MESFIAEPGSFLLKSKNWMISCCSLSHTASLVFCSGRCFKRDPKKKWGFLHYVWNCNGFLCCRSENCSMMQVKHAFRVSNFIVLWQDPQHWVPRPLCCAEHAKGRHLWSMQITLVVRWLILLMGFRNTAVAPEYGESSKSRGREDIYISTGYGTWISEASPIWGFILPDHSHPVCESQTKPSTQPFQWMKRPSSLTDPRKSGKGCSDSSQNQRSEAQIFKYDNRCFKKFPQKDNWCNHPYKN